MSILKEISRYNRCGKDEESFFEKVIGQYPEFEELYKRELESGQEPELDVMEYLLRFSPFLKQEENEWIKIIIQIVRNTSLYFQPQIRSKIMNEGWASFWHDRLFRNDDRISGHETDYAKVNAAVTSLPKVGFNPYALGLRIFQHIRDMENKGRYSFKYDRLLDENARKSFDEHRVTGDDLIFKIRENMNDFTFINTYVNQELVSKYRLFVSGKRFLQDKMVWEYYIKSRKAEDYKQLIIDSLYHPPCIRVDKEKSVKGILYLSHKFEGKPLKQDYIENTMVGIEYLWGGPVHLGNQ